MGAVQLGPTVSAAQVSDSLDASGARGHVLAAGIRPLREGVRIVGRAHPIQFAPIEHDQDDPYREFIEFMDAMKPGDIAVIATAANDRTAYWGELFSAAAVGRGAVGAICDSYVRDTPKIAALGFPVFSAGSRPLDYRARMRVVATGEPVNCAGVLIEPGELMIADDDGIVAIPSVVEAEVVERANARAAAESEVLTDLLAGKTLGEVWSHYGVL
ncbi:MAG: RraA family protein [Mycobacterium sp.]